MPTGNMGMLMLSPEDLVVKTTADIVSECGPKKDCILCNVVSLKYCPRKIGSQAS